MDKQKELYAEYIKYQDAYKAHKKSSRRETKRTLFFGILPALALACILVSQKPVILAILGFVLAGVSCLLFAQLGAKWCKINPVDFLAGREWEAKLEAYLKECGVNLYSAKNSYIHTDKYASDEDRFGPVIVYATEAEVNGVRTPIEVQEKSNKLIILTPTSELIPTP